MNNPFSIRHKVLIGNFDAMNIWDDPHKAAMAWAEYLKKEWQQTLENAGYKDIIITITVENGFGYVGRPQIDFQFCDYDYAIEGCGCIFEYDHLWRQFCDTYRQ
jgi:hypothetical protein